MKHLKTIEEYIKDKDESIDDLIEFNWHYMSKFILLTELFMEKYQDKLNWNLISAYQILSEPFIDKHKDKVNWRHITQYQIIDEPFMLTYKHKVYWYHIFKNNQLSHSTLILLIGHTFINKYTKQLYLQQLHRPKDFK